MKTLCPDMQIDAVIFDFDGILVDTEPFHFQAFSEIFKELGLSIGWEQYKIDFIGFDDRDVIGELFQNNHWEMDPDRLARLADKKASLFAEIVSRADIKPYPGVMELIARFHQVLPIGLCSGSLGSDIYPVITRLNLHETFDAIVTANDVERSKPHPASYQLTIERLQKAWPDRALNPANVITFEDSPAGIESANRAGITTIGVTTNFPADALKEATFVLSSLLDFGVA